MTLALFWRIQILKTGRNTCNIILSTRDVPSFYTHNSLLIIATRDVPSLNTDALFIPSNICLHADWNYIAMFNIHSVAQLDLLLSGVGPWVCCPSLSQQQKCVHLQRRKTRVPLPAPPHPKKKLKTNMLPWADRPPPPLLRHCSHFNAMLYYKNMFREGEGRDSLLSTQFVLLYICLLWKF